MKPKFFLIILITATVFFSCGEKRSDTNNELDSKMNDIAENYVKLVLRAGQLDSDFVDAYYGPESWRTKDNLITASDSLKVKQACGAETDSLLNRLDALKNYKADEMQTLRYRYLYKQLLAVKAKIFMMEGGTLSFDQESKALYDAVAPTHDAEYFQSVLDKLNKVLPGGGDVITKYREFRKLFIIPKDKLSAVFDAAIKECRKRTLDHLTLPEGEKFKVEYVNDKPWSGYNWYKGDYYSLIQINTDLPAYIDRAVDLAAHEGYPGHHVYNSLLEEKLVKGRGWMEYTVYPLFSPQSLIAEGTANFGIRMIFPGKEKAEFEKHVLFPLAGIDTSLAEKYEEVLNLTEQLSYSGNEAARNYLDGRWDAEKAVSFLEKYGLMTAAQAKQRLKFIEKYRSYVINYNLGQDIIKNYIEREGGTESNPEKRWELFKFLLTSPQTPSGLINPSF